MKADDSSLTPEQYKKVRAEALKALQRAGALGQFPTPVTTVLDVEKLVVVEEDFRDKGLIAKFAKMRQKGGALLKRALDKVLGVFDARERFVFIDRTVHAVKQTFLKLHEAGHAILPWQRGLYAVIEDCEKTLAPDVSDLFDREANVFATEVLFQLDKFAQEASDHDFGIKVPINLSKKYGASIYSSIRQYVSKNDKTCVVVVLNPPILSDGHGFAASVRRIVPSPAFQKKFAKTKWPNKVTPDDDLGALVPLGKRRMTGARSIQLLDSNGLGHECVAEAFTTTHQVFILIHVQKSLTKLTFIAPEISL